MMKIIIVPTDFSENSANAMRYAIQMSKSHYFKLIFLHVYSLPFLNPEAGMVYDAVISESMRIQSEKALRGHVEKVFDSLGMHRNLLLSELETVEAMSLAGGIEKVHHHYHADWVMMGTHGATGLKKFFLGSNAVDVIKNSTLPVLTIPDACTFQQMNHLAYASDFKNIESELKQVVDFAAAFQADVHVIHVAQDDITQQYIEVDTLIQHWQTLTKYQRINLHLIQGTEQTPVNESLGKLIDQVQADILIVFHEQRNFWKSLFEKSIAAEIVYEWTRPILTMPKK